MDIRTVFHFHAPRLPYSEPASDTVLDWQNDIAMPISLPNERIRGWPVALLSAGIREQPGTPTAHPRRTVGRVSASTVPACTRGGARLGSATASATRFDQLGHDDNELNELVRAAPEQALPAQVTQPSRSASASLDTLSPSEPSRREYRRSAKVDASSQQRQLRLLGKLRCSRAESRSTRSSLSARRRRHGCGQALPPWGRHLTSFDYRARQRAKLCSKLAPLRRPTPSPLPSIVSRSVRQAASSSLAMGWRSIRGAIPVASLRPTLIATRLLPCETPLLSAAREAGADTRWHSSDLPSGQGLRADHRGGARRRRDGASLRFRLRCRSVCGQWHVALT